MVSSDESTELTTALIDMLKSKGHELLFFAALDRDKVNSYLLRSMHKDKNFNLLNVNIFMNATKFLF